MIRSLHMSPTIFHSWLEPIRILHRHEFSAPHPKHTSRTGAVRGSKKMRLCQTASTSLRWVRSSWAFNRRHGPTSSRMMRSISRFPENSSLAEAINCTKCDRPDCKSIFPSTSVTRKFSSSAWAAETIVSKKCI